LTGAVLRASVLEARAIAAPKSWRPPRRRDPCAMAETNAILQTIQKKMAEKDEVIRAQQEQIHELEDVVEAMRRKLANVDRVESEYEATKKELESLKAQLSSLLGE
jgi:septal ring factor EnvC (AmiA/AmiB activator)